MSKVSPTQPKFKSSTSPTTDTFPTRSDLWTEILSSADRQKVYSRKNVLLLSERHHGRRYLLDQLLSDSKRDKERQQRHRKRLAVNSQAGPSTSNQTLAITGKRSLAMGYEVLQVGEEGDEDTIPPVSIFYPPSSNASMTSLIEGSLPPRSLSDTVVMILLDWTKPWNMVRELLTWFKWVEMWAEASCSPEEKVEMHDRLQSHIQHYTEPPIESSPSSVGGDTSGSGGSTRNIGTSYGHIGAVLPLGPGTLTMNHCGIPIIVVCTKADLIDSKGEEIGMKGAGWEERTDWIQQVLRTICLAYGAALFYTAPTSPHTYTLLRNYLLHRLHTLPPPLSSDASFSTSPIASASSTRFPFHHRANVLDRDAVMVPAGWDSWGKINVLRENFDPSRISKAWSHSLENQINGEEVSENDDRGILRLVEDMIPVQGKGLVPNSTQSIATSVEPEQAFLSRQLEVLAKDRDPTQSFRHAAATASQTAAPASSSNTAISSEESRFAGYGGVVGPMGSGGLSLPGVEKAMAEMEGAEDLKEKFARLGRRETTRPAGTPSTPSTQSGTATGGAVPNEALHNFFQGLLATKAKSSKPPTGAVSDPKNV